MTADNPDPPSSPPSSPTRAQLNPFSEQFDPELALQQHLSAFRATLPTARDQAIFDRAQPVDNVAACAHLEHAPYRILKPAPVTANLTTPSRKRPRDASQHADKSERRLSVLQSIHDKAAKGPLELLGRAVANKLLLRIRLRERHRIRGFVEGVVVAFDRHMNVVVKNAVIQDYGLDARRVGQLLIRGENIVLIYLAT
ncbi:Sm ribonucleoprotein domain containing protein [Gracilaria domingensis]|nr:Sm ribonucleoprotein domain containing protein [Gracilaria domingensis]